MGVPAPLGDENNGWLLVYSIDKELPENVIAATAVFGVLEKDWKNA